MIKCLIIDDSALIREFLKEILNEDKRIQVTGTADNPYKAVEILNNEKIDVITLDLEMPRMDGLTFLDKLMKQRPIPVVVISSIAQKDSENALKALELGACEVITKPKLGLKNYLFDEKKRIIQSIKNASLVNLKNLRYYSTGINKNTKTKINKNNGQPLLGQTTQKVIAIGASTGGTNVLRYILSKLNRTTCGIIITQHMPEGFTARFSESLNMVSELEVKEASQDDKIGIGSAFIAKGNYHLAVKRSGAFYHLDLLDTSPVNRHRPSVDVLFESVAAEAGKNSMGIILTGMGTDGARGLKKIKENGGVTIAQNELSCVVYGMPKAAVELNAVDSVMSIDEIIETIQKFN